MSFRQTRHAAHSTPTKATPSTRKRLATGMDVATNATAIIFRHERITIRAILVACTMKNLRKDTRSTIQKGQYHPRSDPLSAIGTLWDTERLLLLPLRFVIVICCWCSTLTALLANPFVQTFRTRDLVSTGFQTNQSWLTPSVTAIFRANDTTWRCLSQLLLVVALLLLLLFPLWCCHVFKRTVFCFDCDRCYFSSTLRSFLPSTIPYFPKENLIKIIFPRDSDQVSSHHHTLMYKIS